MTYNCLIFAYNLAIFRSSGVDLRHVAFCPWFLRYLCLFCFGENIAIFICAYPIPAAP